MRWIVAAAALLLSSVTAHAISWPIELRTTADRKNHMSDCHMYAVDIVCTPKGDLSNPVDHFIVWQSRSHFLLISTEAPLKTPAADSDKLPSNALAFIRVFTAEPGSDRGGSGTFEGRNCRQSFAVPGGRPLYIVPTLFSSRD